MMDRVGFTASVSSASDAVGSSMDERIAPQVLLTKSHLVDTESLPSLGCWTENAEDNEMDRKATSNRILPLPFST